jgi:YidC/Oxa1 family membrane protein insertase
MFSSIWHGVFFDPIYNTLVFFIDVAPRGDVGLAIIATVVVVKTILLPLSVRAAKTQKAMKTIEPKLKEIKETHKEDKQAQAKAMMEVYNDANISPFASIALILIQIPIVFALYFAVTRGGGVPLPDINIDLLYAFIPNPTTVSTNFLELVDITGRSFILAALAGITQFFQINMTLPKLEPKKEGEAPDLKAEFVRNMHMQMRYVMPVIIAVVAYTISAAIALYFFVSNVVGILQEFYVRKHR